MHEIYDLERPGTENMQFFPQCLKYLTECSPLKMTDKMCYMRTVKNTYILFYSDFCITWFIFI